MRLRGPALLLVLSSASMGGIACGAGEKGAKDVESAAQDLSNGVGTSKPAKDPSGADAGASPASSASSSSSSPASGW